MPSLSCDNLDSYKTINFIFPDSCFAVLEAAVNAAALMDGGVGP